jgi:ribosomal protein S18 acetylase RimI-like enzyme
MTVGKAAAQHWRLMTAADLPAVEAIAAQVHPGYPEEAAIFAERLRLYPPGCRVFAPDGAAVLAYLVSHPWHLLQPPPLDSLLGALPDLPSTYYIHDLALLPQTRGSGAARAVVQALAEHALASGMSNMSLVAVNASTGFWKRNGFAVHHEPALAAKLRSYDAAAQLMIRRLG